MAGQVAPWIGTPGHCPRRQLSASHVDGDFLRRYGDRSLEPVYVRIERRGARDVPVDVGMLRRGVRQGDANTQAMGDGGFGRRMRRQKSGLELQYARRIGVEIDVHIVRAGVQNVDSKFAVPDEGEEDRHRRHAPGQAVRLDHGRAIRGDHGRVDAGDPIEAQTPDALDPESPLEERLEHPVDLVHHEPPRTRQIGQKGRRDGDRRNQPRARCECRDGESCGATPSRPGHDGGHTQYASPMPIANAIGMPDPREEPPKNVGCRPFEGSAW